MKKTESFSKFRIFISQWQPHITKHHFWLIILLFCALIGGSIEVYFPISLLNLMDTAINNQLDEKNVFDDYITEVFSCINKALLLAVVPFDVGIPLLQPHSPRMKFSQDSEKLTKISTTAFNARIKLIKEAIISTELSICVI